MTNIYGQYKPTLEIILNELLTRFNHLNIDYQKVNKKKFI